MTLLRVSVAAVRRGGRFFLQRRAPGAGTFPGLWEFPGGKAEAGESAEEALLRELREETDWCPERLAPLPAFRHAYPGFTVELNPFLCEGTGAPATSLAWGWFTLAEMASLPMPGASREVLPLLEKALQGPIPGSPR